MQACFGATHLCIACVLCIGLPESYLNASGSENKT